MKVSEMKLEEKAADELKSELEEKCVGVLKDKLDRIKSAKRTLAVAEKNYKEFLEMDVEDVDLHY